MSTVPSNPDSWLEVEKLLLFQIQLFCPTLTWDEKTEYFNSCIGQLWNRKDRSKGSICKQWSNMKRARAMGEAPSVHTFTGGKNSSIPHSVGQEQYVQNLKEQMSISVSEMTVFAERFKQSHFPSGVASEASSSQRSTPHQEPHLGDSGI